jgi:CHAT domain-containing protein
MGERIKQDYPRYAELQNPSPCSLVEARACLGRNEVALLFVAGKEGSQVVVLDGGAGGGAGGLAVYPLPPMRELGKQVAALTDRETLALPAEARAHGAAAFALLLAPLADRIRGKDLVIVPGGPLCLLPFELLVEGGEAEGTYLIEGHRVRYATSLTALHLVRLWERGRPRLEQAFWAVGDPVYEADDPRLTGRTDVGGATREALEEYSSRTRSGEAAGGYKRLRFSGDEVTRIRETLGGSKDQTLTGLQASEAAVKAASRDGVLARARYVHFATHGILGADRGLQPSLVLSLVGNDNRAEGGGVNDGFLQLDEVTNLKLNADLVVLSACQSGQGTLYGGEGVVGLSRAFLYAGARGLVCSLWSVDDKQTAELMASTYSRLQANEAAANALRAAKIGMIRQGKAPALWGAFILIGE